MSSSSSTISITGLTVHEADWQRQRLPFENLAQLEFHLSADFLSNSFFFLHHFIRLLNHSIQLVERQGYDKGRTLTYCRFYFNHTMMSLNEILHDVETDSGSRFVVACLIESSEDFLLSSGLIPNPLSSTSMRKWVPFSSRRQDKRT